jgi:hypothetical protein
MNNPELSEAVCYWLSYKAATGTSPLLTEGSLSIPIAESLFFHRWEIDTEKDYSEIFPNIVPKKIYADFYATHDMDKRSLVLETKFFKSSSQSRVFNDIVRLGLAEPDDIRRVLLLAWSKDVKPEGACRQLLSLEKGETLTIDPDQCLLDCAGKSTELRSNASEFTRLRGLLHTPVEGRKIQVTCDNVTPSGTYGSRIKGYGAVEYSIARI